MLRRTAVAAVAGGLSLVATAAAGPRFDPVSVTPDGTAFVNGECNEASISTNGRFVAFYTSATDAVAGDTNGNSDVFVRDRKAGTAGLISVDSDGAQGDGGSYYPLISGNGRWVLFESDATNLVAGDGNGQTDIFLHDRKTGETARVSVAADGTEADDDSYVYGASLSGNGRWAVFGSDASNLVAGDTNDEADVFRVDIRTGEVTLVSNDPNGDPSNSSSDDPSISANGRFVTFYSSATNLVADDTNAQRDIFVFDAKTGTTRRASVASDGSEADDGSYDPVVSNNGQVVAFYSLATNLVAGDTNANWDVFAHDFRSGETTRLSQHPDGTEAASSAYQPCITANGRTVLFYTGSGEGLVPEDTNDAGDVYSFDLRKGTLRLLSVNEDGVVGDGAYSWLWSGAVASNGRWLAISSDASNFSPLGSGGGYQDYAMDPRK
jgi:hypothetical protein